jgi:PilZ domain
MSPPEVRSDSRGMERRRAERVPMPQTGGVVSVVGARLIDVSPYGMMIDSPVALTEDTVLKFRLSIDGGKADVSARVACCTSRPGARRAYGVGLEFLDLAEDFRGRLREILSRPAVAPPA